MRLPPVAEEAAARVNRSTSHASWLLGTWIVPASRNGHLQIPGSESADLARDSALDVDERLQPDIPGRRPDEDDARVRRNDPVVLSD